MILIVTPCTYLVSTARALIGSGRVAGLLDHYLKVSSLFRAFDLAPKAYPLKNAVRDVVRQLGHRAALEPSWGAAADRVTQ